MYRLGRRLSSSRAALAVLLLAVWSVALATPCLPTALSDAPAALLADHEPPIDPCDQHGRDYKVNASKTADEARTLKLAAVAALPVCETVLEALVTGAAFAPLHGPAATAAEPIYLATARLRI